MHEAQRQIVLRLCSAILAPLTLSGCWLSDAYLWRSYQPPVGDSYRPARGFGCPEVGVQNLSTEQAATILAALQTVCEIEASDAFHNDVLATGTLLASCDKIQGLDDTISATTVFALVRGNARRFSVLARKPAPKSVQAQTDAIRDRIAIRKQRFVAWQSLSPDLQGEMLNTLAHEMTHLVRYDDGRLYRFRDRGNGDKYCPQSQLVSYRVGFIVENVWRTRHGLPANLVAATDSGPSRKPIRSLS